MHLTGPIYREEVPNHHRGGKAGTIEGLATLYLPNWNDDSEYQPITKNFSNIE